ncbi:MAG: peptidoglycan editing factor PgeF [Bacteroidales bacterium]|nr:peptidoglycan editing factor PgeF [Bacteroidales bacterium]
MKFESINKLKILSYINTDEIIAGCSTRHEGYSKCAYSSLNVGLNTDDNIKCILNNRKLLFNAIAPNFTNIFLNQVHSNVIHSVDKNFENFIAGDGLITRCKNTLLTITTADCGSVCFHNKENNTIAALHAGWKGTKANIIEEMCLALSKYDSLSNFTAYIGPMIQKDSYEVGEEFLNYFDSKYFEKSNNKILFDLNQCIEDKLIESGIGFVENKKVDTFKNETTFFSYRRDKTTGRMCSYIGLCE